MLSKRKGYINRIDIPEVSSRISVPKQSVDHVIARNPEPGRRGQSNLKKVRKDEIASG
jgi:hypothetical protein